MKERRARSDWLLVVKHVVDHHFHSKTWTFSYMQGCGGSQAVTLFTYTGGTTAYATTTFCSTSLPYLLFSHDEQE
jgi:hypothetical protein